MTNFDYDEKTLQEIIAQNCMLNEENVELRKQMNELKEKNNQLIDDGYIYQRKYELLEYEFDRLKNHHNDGIRQAVKDMAKEILDKAIIIDKNTGNKGFICIEALTELCRSKSV